MNFLKVITFAGILATSSSILAEGGGDKAFEMMMAANAKAMEQYAISQGKNAPVAKQYEYGMALDVVKVISVVRPAKVCAVVPAAMTYEDSEGQLNTVKYTVAGECRQRGG
ncbi:MULTISPECIES: DUF2790 domain-containing protein [Pseudomonas]|jgi:hypothetical protein|uniref:DUF2790 domain-containing protein n=1 Tax=Pseudomonas mandelii JR-1 TaxID=1147786 RepID=A0A024ELS9_9PSED|nr:MULTISPECIES: DUF2790 domain-containing protein [Pseudomonas]MBU0845238.1 DUF2790 domain-containing protein [Gammaproteobacteria bacterium]AHZ73353.1 hypothetical protein OU5_P0101 [Pseudomonas mandelii JR-1]PMV97162.1 DUF2790 domain-containing protein [Pseudomonas sp. GW460-C8]PMW17196.1 DUF2790 domain-containing protein [Pseudomonas sp. GW456-11-11-14-TSB2]PMW21105.1 DUF2790 domain-containing protein [Pseudomonas sp. GW456-E6]